MKNIIVATAFLGAGFFPAISQAAPMGVCLAGTHVVTTASGHEYRSDNGFSFYFATQLSICVDTAEEKKLKTVIDLLQKSKPGQSIVFVLNGEKFKARNFQELTASLAKEALNVHAKTKTFGQPFSVEILGGDDQKSYGKISLSGLVEPSDVLPKGAVTPTAIYYSTLSVLPVVPR